MLAATTADAVLALTAAEQPPPLLEELRAANTELFVIRAAAEAKRPGKRARANERTEHWNTYLSKSQEITLELDKLNLIGTPPPLGETSVWIGRQVALLQHNQAVAMAEVVRWQDKQLIVRAPRDLPDFDGVLMRDAQRSINGLLQTAAPFAFQRLEYLPPPDMTVPLQESGGPRVVGRVGSVDVCLVNGVFGDPLLHLRLRHQRRSLLFDLGDGTRLPARIAHQVTDVFISHAHMDHISGFLWLLRSRMGELPACRLYGPPGLARHIEGFLQSILWDRITAERSPCFEVAELGPDKLQWFRLQAGADGYKNIGEVKVIDGIVLQEENFRIRAIELDHNTPVLAYAFEPINEINIRKDRIKAHGWQPGPWLNVLKQHLSAGNEAAKISLPDGKEADVKTLAAELVLITPGKKLVYASDLSDNRQRLQSLARYAHTFFCEAKFVEADCDQAKRTGHLTTRACDEIASAAEVARLIPFHFSQRYTDNPQQIYDEVQNYCSRVVIPNFIELFDTKQEIKSETVLTLD